MAAGTSDRLFIICALGTAALTWGLIVFGAVVRVTESGLGCGNDWPLCNGTIFPPLDNITAWIEWLHRLFALLIGVCGAVSLALAWRHYRMRKRRVLRLTALAAGFFVLQSALGAIVVFLDLPPTFVTLHLGVAMLLLAALLAAGLTAWHRPVACSCGGSLLSLAQLNAAFALLIILSGALVRGSGATLACVDFPLCAPGVLLLTELGELAHINMLHRFAVAAMGLSLLILLRQARGQVDRLARLIAAAAALVYALQIVVGAAFVFSAAGPAWGAAHVGLAAAVWALLIGLVVIERGNLRGGAP